MFDLIGFFSFFNIFKIDLVYVSIDHEGVDSMKGILGLFSTFVSKQIFGAVLGVLAIIAFVYYAMKKDYQQLSDQHLIGKIAHKFGNLPAKLCLLLLLALLIVCAWMLLFNK